jgi:hypothetical protein
MSKHENLVQFINELNAAKISVDVIALQEIWDVRYHELVNIPGYKPLIYKKRRNMRGGGVGFFIKNSLNGEIIENLSPFENKIFESLTIQLTYPSSHKTILLTSAYRSNGTLPNLSQRQQMEQFQEIFGNLIFELQQTRKESYIFMDANINLLDLEKSDAQTYMNLLFAAGYLQGIFKATRIQNESKSLIDHIHFNNIQAEISSGVIISDISDHFFTFICAQSNTLKPAQINNTVSRDFSLQNLENFKRALSVIDWEPVLSCNDVENAYDCFWSAYTNAYKTNFPLKRKRFNKNYNCTHKFMTVGLLTSRRTKNKLFAKAVSEPNVVNKNRYKQYRPEAVVGLAGRVSNLLFSVHYARFLCRNVHLSYISNP